MVYKIAIPTAGQVTTILAYDGIDFQKLKCNSDGELTVNVDSSALPTDAATETKQDALIAKFQDQAITVKGVIADNYTHTTPGAGTQSFESDAVPSGELWHITHISSFNNTTVCTRVLFTVVHDGYARYVSTQLVTDRYFPYDLKADLWLDVGDKIRVTWYTCGSGDSLLMYLFGYKMTVV